MVRVILYDEACEILNLESSFKEDVHVVAYIKNTGDYFGYFINDKRVYSLQNIDRKLNLIEFDYVVINSRYSEMIYEKLRVCRVDPKKILDLSFLKYKEEKKYFRDKLLYCRDNEVLDFEVLFLGKSYIKDEILFKHFRDYINVSSRVLDIHYNYHLLYYLIKNNKINKRTKVLMFMSYSMMYENINLLDSKRDFVYIFEDIFKTHNIEKTTYTYHELSLCDFENKFNRILKSQGERELKSTYEFSISNFDLEKIKYDTQIETINYSDSNMVAFKMNKNIISQMLKLLYDNSIDGVFIIPPVHEEYRTYINNTLRKEFYSVVSKHINDRFSILDYFNLDLESRYFSSPTNLNSIGCEKFLKVLSCDVKSKNLCSKLCNDL